METTMDIKDDVSEVILNSAKTIFARYGFKKTTMDEIAHASRKGKSSIYHYFKSKEDIFKAIVEKESDVLSAAIAKAINAETTSEKKIRAYVLTRMKVINKLTNLYSALKDEYLEHYSFIENVRVKYDTEEVNTIKGILKTGVEEGDFKIEDINLTAFALVTALKGLEYPLFIKNNYAKTENRFEGLLNVLFYGIIAR
ncbi:MULTISPECIES: TetR/AcrR family transcriptional regulator [Algoriphagus]|jgi:AcrR family transcriptional regulator|nr:MULTISPECIES: TetR/AcrR family transcriptional regulator [Algoriphagus]MBB6327612.1 AcrR family transcriptional regulator [Algoriphagus iocasae]MBS4070461.1 TetR/AcrR family transcriptional regulator [Algoriphagus sp.]MDI1324476.1 TetR/AcrR family transcriptional regulator [Algoriphagus sp.]MDP3200805.1 TetR/AcrR family transcriptional regulator [Algoriphagus sp.]|tara:strand:+ start:30 stop:623 length:594 start_codon:yes stop_codon:yes gene_type:complete